MDIEKSKEICNQFINENKKRPIILHTAIETVLEELNEKDKLYHKAMSELVKADKIIDLMAKMMAETRVGRRAFTCDFGKECNENGCRVCIKQYFKKKVSDEKC